MSQHNNPKLIIETAKVVGFHQGQALVECVSKSACGSCGSAEHCGNSAIAKAFPTRTHQLSVEITEEVKVGDSIELGLNSKNMLNSALLVYLLPLLLLMAGAGMGKATQVSEGVVIITSLCGLLIGFVMVKLYTKRFMGHASYKPKMIRRSQ
ncbi:SoxR reducing system RseC family protein [Agarivorans sp. MS3-6]